MSTLWQSYIKLLPNWLKEIAEGQGETSLTELRLRVGQPLQMRMLNGMKIINRLVQPCDISHIINVATKYSPWTSHTISNGFVTAEGGHRIGICGDVIMNPDGTIKTITNLSSVNVRVAKDIKGIAREIGHHNESVLIIGRPGSGKTTLLRDYIRYRSENDLYGVSVVDERCELFPMIQGECCFDSGRQTDILSGCKKSLGINMMIRCMSPGTIAVDEITDKDDCTSLIYAGWCGVRLLATAHAESKEDLYSRPIYRPIIESKLFQNLIVMKSDKNWEMERILN